jgi:hypothetical protein
VSIAAELGLAHGLHKIDGAGWHTSEIGQLQGHISLLCLTRYSCELCPDTISQIL